jgi:Asp-tRNA(Asn)/Glu-tRNA(Gln) amidotransferase A subunit family amidase
MVSPQTVSPQTVATQLKWQPPCSSAVRFAALIVLAGVTACQPDFVVEEATIAEIHAGMSDGSITAEALVQHYLDRIDAYDKRGASINSLITVSDVALDRARELDAEFATSGLTGPLHGIPFIVKDNYDTYDLPTTNGILALKGSIPPDDAFHVARLREAGAIILAKANLAEFATSGAYSVSSVLPGFSRNPYDTRRVTAGSSGGTAAALAANLGAVGLGSDTGSSIRGPSSHQALVGFRTTMGLSSRDGIAPLNGGRDVGGPMARTVEDAVRVLEIIVGYDEADTVTARGEGLRPDGYMQFLREDGLQDKRIGVLRRFFEVADAEADGPQPSPVEPQDTATVEQGASQDGSGQDQTQQDEEREPTRVHPEVLGLLEQALLDMEAAGATIVDNIEIPAMDSLRRAFPSLPRFRYDFDAYLAARPEVPRRTMKQILDSGDFHPWLRASLQNATEEEWEGAPWEHENWEEWVQVTLDLGAAVTAAMDAAGVDVLVYPTYNYPARLIGDLNSTYGANSGTLSPPTGFPAFNVPMGFVAGGLPSGLQLLGRAFDEGTMIEIAYAYEQTTMHRLPPEATPPIPRR